MDSRPRARHVLGSPGFAPLLAGNVLSITGSFLSVAVTSWVLFELTHSSAIVGLVQVARFVPMVLLTIPAGVLVDHRERRAFLAKLEIVMAAMGIALAVLVWLGQGTVVVLLAFAFAMGVAGAFEGPAWISLLGTLLHEEHMLLGFSMNSMSFHLGATLGPPIGALLLKTVGAGTAFFVNGVSYLAIVVAVALVPPSRIPPAVYRGMRHAISEAVTYIRGSRRARVLIPMSGALSLVVFGIPSVLPALATHVLHGGSGTYGTVMGAFGGGNFLGAIALGAVSSRMRARVLMKGGVTLSAAGIVALAFSRSPAAAVLAMIGVGAGQLVALVTARTLLLAEAGPVLGGRITGVYMAATIGISPAGGLVLGWLTDAFGVRSSVRAAAAYAVAVALATLAGARPRSVVGGGG